MKMILEHSYVCNKNNTLQEKVKDNMREGLQDERIETGKKKG